MSPRRSLAGDFMVNLNRLSICLVVFLLPTFLVAQTHDRAFWQSIGKNKYAVPEHDSADALALELNALLASPDPELRDDLAYSILARWIYRGYLSTQTLLQLTDIWRANLKDGVGESGTNSVLKRSFSALCLSSMAAREAKSPFMGPDRYHQLVAQSVAYLQTERDLRGYDVKLHWIHATAHSADLLGALADSSLLSREEQAAILSAIAARLASAPEVYTQGEQDRLAAAVVAVVRRSDFDGADFDPWLKGIDDQDRDIWIHTTVEALARYQNHNYMLQAFVVHLALQPESPRMEDFQQKVLGVLRAR